MHGPVWAPGANESQIAAAIPVQDEIFAQNADFAHGVVVKLNGRCNRVPVSPHQLSTRRARPHACQHLVLFMRKHIASFLT